jgi:diaminopimelate decarboxylase
MKGSFPIEEFQDVRTPFYYYDTALLRRTLDTITAEAARHDGLVVHYAVKANANPKVLSIISAAGLGADCVSGGEIEAALRAGFPAEKIVFAGVGKADWEINLALDAGIFCFNVESKAELEVIDELAQAKGKVARVCFRINPDVDAHTHANITTGLAENKFGIAMADMITAVRTAQQMNNVEVIGLHFHIGSQITDLSVFEALCHRINELRRQLAGEGITLNEVNVGGGLGIDYDQPDEHPIPCFADYFELFDRLVERQKGQHIHFELGRAVVAQMGTLIARTLYVKEGATRKFAILDAGMTDLIRPALYQAYHKIENLSSDAGAETYDVVGPICESSDVFGKDIVLNCVKRGDLFALRSAGAYGEIMASGYNCRRLPAGYTTEDIMSSNVQHL